MARPTTRIVVPLALLAAVVGAVLLARGWLDRRAREYAAREGVANVQTAVQGYKISKGDYPPDIDTLIQALDDKPALLAPPDLTDPWGRPYVYEPENRHPATGTPRIYSRGADPDDPAGVIANW